MAAGKHTIKCTFSIKCYDKRDNDRTPTMRKILLLYTIKNLDQLFLYVYEFGMSLALCVSCIALTAICSY